MTFEEFIESGKARDAIDADAILPEFTNLVHFENEINRREEESNRRAFFSFSGTVKELKAKLI
jgi:hypothetical protein